MLDLIGANNAASKLLQAGRTDVSNNLPSISNKIKQEIQITGAYDLIFPYIHSDFPTRAELYKYMVDSFFDHSSQNQHFGLLSSNTPTIILPPPIKDAERYVNDLIVRANSPVNEIGYGI